MFLLNLSVIQFLAIFGSLSAVVVALYLMDRSRRRQVVATLRFWTASEQSAEVTRRRKIQQPLSLVLQLLSIALLLLAIAQLRLGSQGAKPRDHVVILDTSAWMGARSQRGVLMDRAKSLARAYVRGLPSGDRVMLVRADALATPATVFETNRQKVEEAILDSTPAATAVDLQQALEFAKQAQRLQAGRHGEVTVVTAGRILERESQSGSPTPSDLRVLSVSESIENCGLRKIGLRRSTADPESWEILVGVKNYGTSPRTLTLGVHFGGAVLGTRRLTINPSAEQSATFHLRTRAAGLLEARLLEPDLFRDDDGAVIELPAQEALRVAVFSEQPELLRPLFSATPLVQASFHRPSEYRGAGGAQIVILDRFRPSVAPETDAIWIEPPERGSPVPIRSSVNNVAVVRWRSDHPLAAGLRTQDLKLDSAAIFRPLAGDIAIAEAEAGPVILARPGKVRTVVFGFHPVRSARYELATPLLFANILQWMAPEIFRRWELNAGSAGTVNAPVSPDVDPASVRVVTDSGSPLPFTVQGPSLRFFAATRGTVRILSSNREMVYSLTLPEVAEAKWTAPGGARRGLPRAAGTRLTYVELWHWLAILGGLGLLAEWLIFGRSRARYLASRVQKQEEPRPSLSKVGA